MNECVHHIPGRLRLRLAALRQDEARARRVRKDLASVAGVRGIRTNVRTATVVVNYDPAAIGADTLLAVLQAHGHTHTPLALPVPHTHRLAAVDRALFEALAVFFLERLAVHAAQRFVPALASALLGRRA